MGQKCPIELTVSSRRELEEDIRKYMYKDHGMVDIVIGTRIELDIRGIMSHKTGK